MNSTVSVLINQVIVMFVLMIVGMILYKIKKIDNQGASQLSFIVLYVSSPLLVLQSMMVPYDGEKLKVGMIIFFLSILIHAIFIILMKMIYKNKKRLAQFAVIYSNSGFLGIPLVENVLGSNYVFYLSVFLLSFNLLAWTYGVYLISEDAKEISIKKIVTNPCIIAIVLGITFFVTSIQLPNILIQSIKHLASMNTALAMMVLGVFLAQTDFKKMFKDKDLWIICLFRLFICPMVTILILSFIPITIEIKTVIVIAYAAPCASMLAMLSQKYGNDYKYGAGVVGVTTLLSLFTMPLFINILYMI